VVFQDWYDAELDYLTTPDPQDVPAQVLERVDARVTPANCWHPPGGQLWSR
jgi:hypothetical protein